MKLFVLMKDAVRAAEYLVRTSLACTYIVIDGDFFFNVIWSKYLTALIDE